MLVARMKKQLSQHLDVFISYASEDRIEVVEPLVHALCAANISVWYDQFELKVGDSLRRKIEEGLARSDYGIVILSQHFFGKHFPNLELNGLAQREVKGEKVILPIWYNVDAEDVRNYSSPLADRVATDWKDGVSVVVEKLMSVLRPDVRPHERKPKAPRRASSNYLLAGAQQGDACPHCEKGRLYFLKWAPGPAGSFTAHYQCGECRATFATNQEFDGGLV